MLFDSAILQAHRVMRGDRHYSKVLSLEDITAFPCQRHADKAPSAPLSTAQAAQDTVQGSSLKLLKHLNRLLHFFGYSHGADHACT